MKKVVYLLFALVTIVGCKDAAYKGLDEGLYANVQTDRGSIILKLHHDDTPLTVANFISLAEGTNPKVIDSLKGKKFYDGLVFHRVIKDFMVQGGDPLANGTGGPGYKFFDEFPRNSANSLIHKHDTIGVLSMANSGPRTNGSQFFITHKPTPWLDNKHTVFGKVVKGQKVVDSIAQNDIIKSVKIIRIGRKAKSFDAVKTFEDELSKFEEREKERLAQVEKAKKAFREAMGYDKAIETDSGLRILKLEEGKGKNTVTETSTNTSLYKLYLATGDVIQETTLDRPFKFNFSERPMIAGFKEGVLGLKEGAKVRLFIPYYLGYGESAYGPFPAKADIIFEVEILKIGK